MRRSLLHYTRILVLPLLAVGLALTGCDSGGSNGGDGNDNGDPSSEVYPAPSSGNGYAEEIAINIQSADLGIRLEGSSPSSSTLQDIYNGNQNSVSSENIQLVSGITGPSATTYGGLPAFANIKGQILTEDLLKSADLESADSDNPGTAQNADELITFYLSEAKHTSSNGVDFSQLSEKGVAGALTYADAANILNSFRTDQVESEEKWNEAFGHFGAPRDFKAFLDLDESGGLSAGSFQDIDGNNTIDLVTEGVYIWAGYTAERAAAAQSTGNDNNFAERAFDAFRDGREAIDNGNTDELSGPDGFAATALDAWEATVAVNVIHYTNSLESALEDVEGEITRDKVDPAGFQDSWGEAKAFAWSLQFESEFSDSQLETIHDKIGNDPPYSEGVNASDYSDDLAEVQQTIQDAYGFAEENVAQW
ncbi:MAG: hypothetical protein BRD30_04670 [Bacteroidetes bacterium QH_2_63_10]|nr:MAG: hypothetical protein BRD30_04670 [Bacteroidetes bacterium QH_2_63_10]